MKRVLPLLFLFVLLLTGCYDEEAAVPAVSLDELPAYAGEPYVTVNAKSRGLGDVYKRQALCDRQRQPALLRGNGLHHRGL